MIAGYRGLIDSDTPNDMLTRTGFDGKASSLTLSLLSSFVLTCLILQDYQLVFSDEVSSQHFVESRFARADTARAS